MIDVVLEQHHNPTANADFGEYVNPFEYYAQHSFITKPHEHADLFTGLPTNIPGLVRVVQGLLIHPFCVTLYQVQFSPIQREEIHLRTVAQMLARIRELDPTPLTVAREPAQRLVGNCRDHAVLFTALLRQQGIPARMRVGFARYFPSNKNEDHWITEYWDAVQSGSFQEIQSDPCGGYLLQLRLSLHRHHQRGQHRRHDRGGGDDTGALQ